jgi:enhancing lycopene biosynthesis protein 2
MSPDCEQTEVIDHLKGTPAQETRNVLVESSRIARGEIKDIKEIIADDLDALIFPGGLGAAKNLCDFAVKGTACTVNAEVEKLIREMHTAKKPIGFICIAPVIAAKVLGANNPELTIGNDEGTAGAIEQMGGKHVESSVDNAVTDETNKIVTTSAYMLGPTISRVALGIEKLVNEILRLA